MQFVLCTVANIRYSWKISPGEKIRQFHHLPSLANLFILPFLFGIKDCCDNLYHINKNSLYQMFLQCHIGLVKFLFSVNF